MDMDNAAQLGASQMKAGVEQGKAAMEQFATASNQQLKDSVDKGLTALNDLNAQSKRNLEALVASVTAATKGAEALGAQAMSYTKKAMEENVQAAKALTGARTVQEVVELQTTFAKAAMEAYIAEMNRASEIVASTVKDSMRPLNERATSAVEAMQSVR